jgi:hypothetical protein
MDLGQVHDQIITGRTVSSGSSNLLESTRIHPTIIELIMDWVAFAGHYIRIVFGNVWGIVVVITAAVNGYMQWFDTKPNIPRGVRVWSFVAIVVIAQAVAYRQLANNPPVIKTSAPLAPPISKQRENPGA